MLFVETLVENTLAVAIFAGALLGLARLAYGGNYY